MSFILSRRTRAHSPNANSLYPQIHYSIYQGLFSDTHVNDAQWVGSTPLRHDDIARPELIEAFCDAIVWDRGRDVLTKINIIGMFQSDPSSWKSFQFSDPCSQWEPGTRINVGPNVWVRRPIRICFPQIDVHRQCGPCRIDDASVTVALWDISIHFDSEDSILF